MYLLWTYTISSAACSQSSLNFLQIKGGSLDYLCSAPRIQNSPVGQLEVNLSTDNRGPCGIRNLYTEVDVLSLTDSDSDSASTCPNTHHNLW